MNDRKYRHRGYMDSEGESRGPRGPRPSGPRPPKPEGPRGRGIDQAKAVVFACRSCGETHRDLEDLKFETKCGKCGAAMHACAQCTYFDTSVRWECTQAIPERIAAKKLANTCTFFSPLKSFDLTGSRGSTATPDDARAAFDRLFKK